ncbi:MAG: signal peptidase II [Actinomycetaceae bacterium]|nr:signal peptidase II [Actinomycetaceae bacterium]
MSPKATTHRGYLTLALLTAILALITDQGTKMWALHALQPGQVRPLIGNFISLQLVFNPGAAFSFLAHSTWIFTAISIIITIAILWYLPRVRSWLWGIVLGLILGGAVGNLIDRLIRPPAVGQGHVVDFLNWNGWFIGNIADIWIVGGAAAIFLLTAFNISATEPKTKHD